MRNQFIAFVIITALASVLAALYLPALLWVHILLGPIVVIGLIDLFQRRHAVRRNWPVLGWFRYLFEMVRPEINQYFVESDTDGRPLNREERSLIYQRAKGVRDTIPFGTKRNVYEPGYEWVNHSIMCRHIDKYQARVTIGNKDCSKPYSSSILNISAMSFGSLSHAAIRALNIGANKGKFAHNTGEGGLSPYHLEHGADLIWQVGTGYFGCRDQDGNFSPTLFAEKAVHENVKMIELKLSQGAKPGHGGILPAGKVTPEIAAIRNVPMGQDVLSPPNHSAFSTPKGLILFLAQLRELSGGKPVGFKLCIGRRHEFIAICKAMIQLDIFPDFITIDGGEGGTGAAPVEFSNNIGSPLYDALVFVENVLTGFDIRQHVKVIASGKLTTSFGIIKRIALGADVITSARAFMLALGCIQALQCNSNKCPVGVATQKKHLIAGLDIPDKSERVYNLHKFMINAAMEIIGSMGLKGPGELHPRQLLRRINNETVRNYSEIYKYVEPGAFLKSSLPPEFKSTIEGASPDTFERSNAIAA